MPFFAAVPVDVVTPDVSVVFDAMYIDVDTVVVPSTTDNASVVVVGKCIGSSGYTTVAAGADEVVVVPDYPESQLTSV